MEDKGNAGEKNDQQKKTNKDYPELLDDIINLGVINYKNRSRKTTTFDSNILEGFSGFKGVKGIKGGKL